jgi:hypothetical protein
MKILSLLDEITHVYQIIIASGSAPSLRQWFRTLLEASIFSMYANTVINIHVGTDGDINVDTDALVERVSRFWGSGFQKAAKSRKNASFLQILAQNR